jgi:hypothetical protein
MITINHELIDPKTKYKYNNWIDCLANKAEGYEAKEFQDIDKPIYWRYDYNEDGRWFQRKNGDSNRLLPLTITPGKPTKEEEKIYKIILDNVHRVEQAVKQKAQDEKAAQKEKYRKGRIVYLSLEDKRHYSVLPKYIMERADDIVASVWKIVNFKRAANDVLELKNKKGETLIISDRFFGRWAEKGKTSSNTVSYKITLG